MKLEFKENKHTLHESLLTNKVFQVSLRRVRFLRFIYPVDTGGKKELKHLSRPPASMPDPPHHVNYVNNIKNKNAKRVLFLFLPSQRLSEF